MFRSLTVAAFASAAVFAAVPASAQTQVGVLECAGGPNVSFVVGSVANLSCTFKPSKSKGTESYAATVRRVGVDIGFTDKTMMSWLVFAPSGKVAKNGLAGNYGGVAANAAIGVGGGANLLVGGSNNSISLQPLSVQGQTGLNVAAAIASLELKRAAPPKPAKKSSSKKKK